MFIPLSSGEPTVNGFTVTIWGATSVYTRIIWGINSEWIYCNNLGGTSVYTPIIWGINSEWIYCNNLGGRPVFIPLSSRESTVNGFTVTIRGATSVYTLIIWGTSGGRQYTQ